MAILIDFRGLSVLDAASAPGGEAINNDLIELATRAGPVHSEAGDPDTDDDDVNTGGSGKFYVWSKWVNTATDAIFILVDSTPGAAVWIEVSGGSGLATHLADLTNPHSVTVAQVGAGTIIGDDHTYDLVIAASAYGSNTRGYRSVDLQTDRAALAEVASGNNSVISGGGDNTASGAHSTVSGGQNNEANQIYATISGGSDNTASGTRASVGGGQFNVALGTYSVVAGGGGGSLGLGNEANAAWSAVLGGKNNTVNTSRNYGVIVGGEDNDMLTAGTHGFIGGGQANQVTGDHGVICGGENNIASGLNSFVGGGGSSVAASGNHCYSQNSVVVGGLNNYIASSQTYSAIVGGANNDILTYGTHGFIGGGQDNHVVGNNSVVVGGATNQSEANNCIIGSGTDNTIVSGGNSSGIFGGDDNYISGNNSVIGGGAYNQMTGGFGFIGGGGSTTASLANELDSDYSVIVGGRNNECRRVVSTDSFTFVSAGDPDTITRSTGSFVTEGFLPGMTIVVSGTTLNNGTYTITAVATLTLTLTSIVDVLTLEGPVSSTITSTGDMAIVTGGENNVAGGDHSSIVGGENNIAGGLGSFVGGGGSSVAASGNKAHGPLSAVVGGLNNDATGAYAFVGGGLHGQATGRASVVCGGSGGAAAANLASGDYSFIGGGGTDPGYTGHIASGHWSFIGGGGGYYPGHVCSGNYSVIVGGGGVAVNAAHTLAAVSGFIGGGENHSIEAGHDHSTICGGQDNEIKTTGTHGFIGGGQSNDVLEDHAVVCGGENNISSGLRSFVGGGGSPTAASGNHCYADLASIVGGQNNDIAYGLNYSVIGGGQDNDITTTGTHQVLGGGQSNLVSGDHGAICGGESNTASGAFSFVGGGGSPTASLGNEALSSRAVVCGGRNNVVAASRDFSSIVGGEGNDIDTAGTHSFIGGGLNNVVSVAYGAICGGKANTVLSTDGFIGGGDTNQIKASSGGAVISGGINHYCYNAVSGTISGGDDNESYADYSTICGGQHNTATGLWGTVAGGRYNLASGAYAVASGVETVADKHGQVAQSGGRLVSDGDAQGSDLVVRRVVTHNSGTQFVLTLDGAATPVAGNSLTLASDTVWAFECLVVGAQAGMAASYAYKVTGLVENDGGTTTVRGVVTVAIDEDSDASFNATASFNDTLDSLEIIVTDSDDSGLVVSWVGYVRITELTFV